MPATELFKTTVSTVLSKLTEKPALVYAHAKQSIEECLQLMALHNITALPITANGASTSSDFQGIVNLFDILYFVAFCAVPDDVSHAQGTAYMDKQAVEQMKQPIASLLDTNDRTRESFRLWSFGQGDTLDKVLETLSKGVHRVLVTGGKTGVMLSQTDLLKYIQNHEPEFKKSAEYDQTLRQLKLFPSRPYGKSGQAVVSVLHSVSALAAYRKMAKEGVTAVPVLNAQGQVVATLSASDLRGLAPLSLKDLLLPVDQFLEKRAASLRRRHATQIVADPEKTSMRDTIIKLLDAKVHHVWLIQPGHKLVGVVSMTDLMSKLSPYDYLK